MINLLPPPIKEELRFARLNRLVLRYISILGAVAVVLGGVFGGTFYLLHQQATAVAMDVATQQATIAVLDKTFTPKAKDASDRLQAIKYVQVTQTRFSGVVADLAKVLPKGVSIDSMTLTGNDKAPVRISVTAATYESALALRDAIITSPRVAGADLETISFSSGVYQTSVVIGFKPGMAK